MGKASEAMHTRSKRYLRRKRGKLRATQLRAAAQRIAQELSPPAGNGLAAHIATAMQKSGLLKLPLAQPPREE